MKTILSRIYQFKPLRTAAQSLVAALIADGTDLLNTDWTGKGAFAGMAGLVAFLQIWAEGGAMFGTADQTDTPEG